VQILAEDYDAGTLQTQDKKTGQVTTLRFDPDKGQMVGAAPLGSAGAVAVPPAAPAAPATSAAPMTKDAAFAQAKLDATLNPDVDVVREDYASGTLQIRDKKTGQVTTLRFNPDKGQMVADAPRAASTVSLPAPAPTPAVRTSAPAASASSSSLPSWIPSYPHATPMIAPAVQANADGSRTYWATFATSDTPHAIVEYYRNKLEADGFAVTMKNVNDVAEFAELTKGDHKIQVVGAINKSNGQTMGTYTATEK
jgi:hypothetical protein